MSVDSLSPFVTEVDSNRPECKVRIFAQSPNDEICITGMAGVFPDSRNVAEFEHNLWNQIDMMSEDNARWPHYHPEIPKRMGNVPEIDKFDAQFFGVHYKQANFMDPQARLLQERAYEAVIDAGVHPQSLRGSRTGVFVGACFGDSEKTLLYGNMTSRGFGITGCCRALLANRISYALGIQGPSFLVDTACSSSMYALDLAFSAIRSGQCDAAIVGGSNLLLEPELSLEFARLGVLAKDGFCRPFDIDAHGYTRSEAVVAVFLQKAKTAKRIYAKLLYAKTNCDGHKSDGISFPSRDVQQKLLAEFYSDLQLDAGLVNYVEAHSTGTVISDPEECAALDSVMCRNRQTPLLIGSVKSNMGHSEAASGVCSLAKVLLALEKCEIPPNIRFMSNRSDIPSMQQQRIKVCTEVTRLPDDALIGINSFGLGGANAHALLTGNRKAKVNGGRPDDDIPRLVNWSGRTEEAITVMLDYLKSVPLDAEYIGLLHGIQSGEESGFLQRGFGVFTKGPEIGDPAVCHGSSEQQRFDGVKRPLIWIFSGMGSQWNGMGSSLMVIPMFKESILRSHHILMKFDINLVHIITDADTSIFENIVNSFVSIAAIQIALVDVLMALNIQPDYLIGHSVGELGCAYADGALSHEQTIVSSYYRGLASVNAKLIRGSMAAVGMGYNELKTILPADIDAACHNSAESTTISGPEKSVAAFVAHLKSQDIFAKEVPTSNIAYHSRYVKEIGDLLLTMTKDLIPPARRSAKWLSTSVPHSKWDEPDGGISNHNYFVNNLRESVLFDETCALLPSNAIAIEIGPHGLLQAIVKRSMPATIHIPLTQRSSTNNAAFFLSALGKLYVNGWTMPLEKLYPPIVYPVSRGTAKISHLLQWDHSESLFVSKFSLDTTGERRFTINLADEEFAYVAGHRVDGRCLFPATGYLELVWKTFAAMKVSVHDSINVEFEDVQFLRATALPSGADIQLTVMVNYGSGSFEVSEGSTAIVSGVIRELDDNSGGLTELEPLENYNYTMLNREDFYKEMRLRGYIYQGVFQSVLEVRCDGSFGKIHWTKNWVSFMDGLIQTTMPSKDSRSLMLPTRLRRLRIFAKEHLRQSLQKTSGDFNVCYNKELNIVQSGGIEIVGLVTQTVARRREVGNLVLESYRFVQHNPSPVLSQHDAYQMCFRLLMENNPTLQSFKVLEVRLSSDPEYVFSFLEDIIAEIPCVTATFTLLTNQDVDLTNVIVENKSISSHPDCHLIILSDLLVDSLLLNECQQSLVDQGFVIVRKPLGMQANNWFAAGLNVIAEIRTDANTIFFLRKRPIITTNNYNVIDIPNSTDFDWLDQVKASIKNTSVLLVSQNNTFAGIIGLVNCISHEPDTKDVSCVIIDDPNSPPFDLNNKLYSEQLSLNLTINVYRDGSWGSYRYQRLEQNNELKPRFSHHYVNALQPGDLSSLSWLQGPLDHHTNDRLVRIQYSAINFKDIMLATGRLSSDTGELSRLEAECVLGFEYSGITQQGQRVMGIVPPGSMATFIQPFAPFTWNVPTTWSLQEAATVPVVYVTVYYALFKDTPNLTGKSILIHAGSGGVGLAAIRVALAYDMEVFTTVSSATKKQYILKLFPKLKECNIGNSRDCTFEQMIHHRTSRKGVDFVLNSLSDEKLQASIRCLGRGGVFLEIGKFDLTNDTKIGLGLFLNEMSFRSVLVDNLMRNGSADELHVIHGRIERDIQKGIIQPLKSTVFQVDEIEKAFRFLSTGQHMGKVLVQLRREATDKHTLPIRSLPRAYCTADKVYIIPGGLGGFGLELADWLVLRGARIIVLSSRRGLSTKYQEYRIRIWQNYGCRTIIITADISTAEGCRALIDEAQQYGQIDGIFNLALCLRDGLLENQTVQSFEECAAPKSVATAHLDQITRQMGIRPKYFVVFSSYSGGLGNAGQSNYALVNAVMERIVEKRVADGLSGKAIQWGAIGEVGIAAELSGYDEDFTVAGTSMQRISSCLNVLDTLLTTPDPIVGSMLVATKHHATTHHSGKKATLVETVLNIMSIQNTKTISMNTTLAELGVDSLMTIEIKQALEREFNVCLSTKDLRDLSFQALHALAEIGSGNASLKNATKSSESDDALYDAFNFKNMHLNESADNPECPLISKCSKPSTFNDPVLILPGTDGDTKPVWSSFCKKINAPTFIANYGTTFTDTCVVKMAETYAKFYLEKISQCKQFLIVGYSFGTLVAIEIVRILEASGLRGHLVCIDGSPVFLKQCVLKSINADSFNVAKMQKAIFKTIASIYIPTVDWDTLIENRLDMLENDWHAKLQAMIDLLVDNKCDFNEKILVKIANGIYNRSCSVFSYQVNGRIQCNITLARASEPYITDIEEKYELESLTEGSVNLAYVEGSHFTALNSSSVVKLINRLLTVSQSETNL